MNSLDDNEMIRILETYGVVNLYTSESGEARCTLRSFWEPGMPRRFEYRRTGRSHSGDGSPVRSSYEALYHEMFVVMRGIVKS